MNVFTRFVFEIFAKHESCIFSNVIYIYSHLSGSIKVLSQIELIPFQLIESNNGVEERKKLMLKKLVMLDLIMSQLFLPLMLAQKRTPSWCLRAWVKEQLDMRILSLTSWFGLIWAPISFTMYQILVFTSN